MIFITGGKYQGRLKCAIEVSGYDVEDVFDFSMINSSEYANTHKGISECKIWYNLQEYIRALTYNEIESYQIEKMVKNVVDNNKPEIIVMAEVGAGVIPLEQSEVTYREVTGRISSYYAGVADEVYRVICGIKTQLK